MSPLCSIVVADIGEHWLTQRCLRAIRETVDDKEIAYETIVVAGRAPGEAWNEGMRRATGRYVLFLRNDVTLEDGCLARLVAYMEELGDVAIVGAKVVLPDDTIRHAGLVFGADLLPRYIYRRFPTDHPATCRSRRFQAVSGGCLLVRRSAMGAIGGFDDALGEALRDADLCLQLADAGHEAHFVHDAVATCLRASERLPDDKLVARFCRRWGHRVTADDLTILAADGLLTVRYEGASMMGVSISSWLQSFIENSDESAIFALLDRRAELVQDLLRENLRLGRWRQETTGGCPPHPEDDAPAPADDGSSDEPVVIFRGRVHQLGGENPQELVSILIPTKNGASQLAHSLPRVLNQRGIRSLEIIAVDSGSTDGTIELLRDFGATIIAVDPRSFNHGLTRNLAAGYAEGHVYVFMNQGTMPGDEQWLINLIQPLRDDPRVAGACSRVLPREDVDPITYLDGLQAASAASERAKRFIADRKTYDAMSHDQKRLFINFHTVSCAIRPAVFDRIPFRDVLIGEDILWAKEVIEAGFAIQHEPSSVVRHAHAYSYLEILKRNADDGRANRTIVDRTLSATDVLPLITGKVHDDWNYLRADRRMVGEELEKWQIASVLHRAAQVIGQWIGVNHADLPAEMITYLSLFEEQKRGRASVGASQTSR